MKKTNRQILWVAAVIVLTIYSPDLGASAADNSQLADAAKLIDVLRSVDVGTSSESDSRRLMAPFVHIASEGINGQGVREVSYTFYNDKLKGHKRSAPYAHLQVVLLFQRGIAVRKSMNMSTGNGISVLVQEEMWRGPGDDGAVGNHDVDRPDRLVQGNKNEFGKYALITVRDDSRLSPERLKRDWNINVGCLVKDGGCADAREILPALGNDPVPQQP